MAAMNKNSVVAFVALFWMKKRKRERKDRQELFGQGPGCYAEKLMVLSIQYSKN